MIIQNITNIDHITEWSEFRNDQQYLRLFEDKLKVEYLPLDGFQMACIGKKQPTLSLYYSF